MFKTIKNIPVPQFLVKSKWLKKISGLILTPARSGQNQNIFLVEINGRSVLIPPLSGSSSFNAYASNLGLQITKVCCCDLAEMVADRDVVFVFRPDFNRLLSFYNKKLRNPGNLSKWLLYLSFSKFSIDMSFTTFLKQYKNMRNNGEYLDKHLLLNQDFLNYLGKDPITTITISELFDWFHTIQSLY